MSDEARQQRRPDQPDFEPQRRWALSTIVALIVVVPIGILIFSNLDSTEVSWAGFAFEQPLWLVLLTTFIAGMIGGKLFGWGWRRYRQRRKRLKEELAVLRKHSEETERRRAHDDS